ncbi:electron transport complex subunit RsxC [candidate division NPL-UPA2 bacterium]|nr:electron transport complex subunit RsxC [candidate division NPL-UPA2 bacterium]
MVRTFGGGIHPQYFRELTRDKPIREAKLPGKVVIPLSQHTGALAEPRVKVGDEVKVGTRIGESDKFISSPIHSSLSGKVAAIEKHSHPVLGSALAVVIEGDGKDEREEPTLREPEEVTPEEVRKIIAWAGIVGLGGAAFPTHVKLTPPQGKRIDTFILNGAECEPYLTGDYRIMVERANGVVQGLRLIMRTLGVKQAYVGVEKDKVEAIESLSEALRGEEGVEVVPLEVRYPQGAEKQLIKTLLDREVPSEGLPLDVGCVVNNVGTALAIYEAVKFGKPLYERVVTVTGRAVNNPLNLRARIGTPIGALIEECGGFREDAGKVIVGGPMMGLAQYTLDVPVTKGTSGILCLREREAALREEMPCIRCARCVDTCPMGLLPTELRKEVRARRWEKLSDYNLLDCMECGCCQYVCPAHIPLVHLFKLGKSELARLKRS